MEGDPGFQQSEASDDGASSSQYELVEEEAGADGLEEAHQVQQQPAQAGEQRGEQHVPSSNPSTAQEATSVNPDSSAAEEVSHSDTPQASAASAAELSVKAVESPQCPEAAETTDAEFKQLEERAKQVAQGMQDMASTVSKSLQAGIFTALGSATDATSSIGHLSIGNNLGKLSSWWSNLDATMAAGSATASSQQQAHSSNSAAGAPAADVAGGRSAELEEAAGLEAGENLVESFTCKLVQTYACNHNTCTPAIQMTFAGRLFITDRHACFIIDERGKKAPIKMRLSDVSAATRERGAHRGDASDVLKIMVRAPGRMVAAAAAAAGASSSSSAAGGGESAGAAARQGPSSSTASGGVLFGLLPPVLGGHTTSHTSTSSSSSGGVMLGGPPSSGGNGAAGGGYWVAFSDFEGSAGLDNALALVEHLREGT